jgi:hypothetical protein
MPKVKIERIMLIRRGFEKQMPESKQLGYDVNTIAFIYFAEVSKVYIYRGKTSRPLKRHNSRVAKAFSTITMTSHTIMLNYY